MIITDASFMCLSVCFKRKTGINTYSQLQAEFLRCRERQQGEGLLLENVGENIGLKEDIKVLHDRNKRKELRYGCDRKMTPFLRYDIKIYVN